MVFAAPKSLGFQEREAVPVPGEAREPKSALLDLAHGILALLELRDVDFGLAAVFPAQPNLPSADGSDHSPRGKGEESGVARQNVCVFLGQGAKAASHTGPDLNMPAVSKPHSKGTQLIPSQSTGNGSARFRKWSLHGDGTWDLRDTTEVLYRAFMTLLISQGETGSRGCSVGDAGTPAVLILLSLRWSMPSWLVARRSLLLWAKLGVNQKRK